MQVCTLLQTDNHTSTSPFCFFTGQMPFLLPNQQHQSTEGNCHNAYKAAGILKHIVCHILGYCCRSVDIILQCYYLLLDKNLHLTFEQ